MREVPKKPDLSEFSDLLEVAVPSWDFTGQPGIILMRHANIVDVAVEKRYIHWQHTEKSVKNLASYVIGIMREKPHVDLFCTPTERTSATALKAAEILRENKIDVTVGPLWNPQERESSQLLDTPLFNQVKLSRDKPQSITMLVAHEATPLDFDVRRYLNYSEIIDIQGSDVIDIASGYTR